ncbi:MAG: DUF1232 domain-containing protein [Candidatus Riflebacteria bacterium]|nr:DUF1232 domain-containing protein [Candidatus Riflebacteria bacterium]
MNEEQPSLIKRLHNNPNAQKVLLILTIIYILSPFDIASEAVFGPIIGYLDDFGIVLAEIVQFLVYMKNKKAAFEKKVQDTAINNEKQKTNNEENK